MFMHNKRLQYTVRVGETNPALASLLLEQFGGPDGELAAAMRYFTQGLAEDDPGRKDLLLDIATEELSHLEVIGSIVAMLNKGIKAQLSEAALAEADLYRSLNAGGDSHTQALLFGGGPSLTNSSGVPWTAAYVDSRGEPTCDLRSNIAAESRAKIIYERLIAITDDPGIKDALGFLMTREIAHQKSFEKALYAITDNFPSGKLLGIGPFADMYVNTSQGDGDMSGPWNAGEQWERVDDLEEVMPADEGDGTASVKLSRAEATAAKKASDRLASDPMSDAETGADLGAGPGAGKTTGGEDYGTAADVTKADRTKDKASLIVTPPPPPEAVATADALSADFFPRRGAHRSVRIPVASFWRKLFAFSGPGYLVAVGYMDPGNWATGIAGGSAFGYRLLSVIVLANLMAMFLQRLAARLGIVTGLDLAQACRQRYGAATRMLLWLLCELAIVACDLAELIGAAIALKLLFGLDLALGVALTGIEVLLVLALQARGFRKLEALVVSLMVVIGLCFVVELALAQPPLAAVLDGLVPRAEIVTDPAMLYLAIGILGATVMPHNLYLHSSIVQTRDFRAHRRGQARGDAVRDHRHRRGAHACHLRQCVDPRTGRLDLPCRRHDRGRGHRGGLSPADAGVGRRRGRDAVRGGAAGVGPQRFRHRHHGRTDRHGRVYPLSLAGVGAPARGPPAGHGAGAVRRHGVRRGGGDAAPHPEPGRAEPAAALRRLSPGASDGQQGMDGQVRQRSAHRGRRLGDDGRPDRAERRAACGNDDIAQRISHQTL